VDKKSSKAYRDADWLREKYREERLSFQKIARLCGVHWSTIRNWVIRHGIRIRTLSEATATKRLAEQHKEKIGDAERGEKHYRWGGGYMHMAGGYIAVLRPNHPHTHASGYLFEHRLVMEEHLGRYLKPEEVVHHINGHPSDNRIENLMLFASNAEHLEFHRRMEQGEKNNAT